MSKKIKIRNLDLIFLGYMIIAFVRTWMEEIGNMDFLKLGYDEKYMPILVIWAILGCLFITFLSNWWMVAIYIGIRNAIKKHNKERLSEIDFKNKEIYYRDIIKKYSPGVLNYIDNFVIDKNTIYATLMSLELKNKINNDFEIIDNDLSNLDENEKYILNKIKNNELQNINIEEYMEYIINDCKTNDLVKEKEKSFSVLKKGLLIMFVSFLIISFGMNFLIGTIMSLDNGEHLSDFKITIGMVSIIGGSAGIFYSFVYMFAYSKKNSEEPYIRTSKAKEINRNLEGLKKYITEYSLLEEQEKESLKLWEEYLIYSVIFKINQNIVKDYEEKLKNKI